MGQLVFAAIIGGSMASAFMGCSLLLDDDFSGRQSEIASDDASDDAPAPGIDAPTSDAPNEDVSPSSDAGWDADAGDDAGDLLPNLVVNPGFETPSCAGWKTEYATASDTPIQRDGVRGCVICGIAGNPQAQLYQSVPAPLPLGASFTGEIWVRSDPAEPPPAADALGLEIDLRAPSQPYPIDRGKVTYASKALSAEWQRINAAMTVKYDTGTEVQLFLHFPGATRTCVVVDTARLVRTN